MYKATIIVLSMLCTSTLGFGQRSEFAKVFSTFKKGIGISYLAPNDAESSRPRIGLHIGFAPSFSLSEKTYLKPELAFSSKGGRVDYSLDNLGVFDGEVTFRISYLELPIVYGYKVNRIFSVEGGAYGAVPLIANFQFDGQFGTSYGSFDKDAIHDFDYGLVGGIKIGPIGVRYYYGLSPVSGDLLSEGFLGDATQHGVQIYLQRDRFRFN